MNIYWKKLSGVFVLAAVVSACQAPPPPVTSGMGAESITNEVPPATYLKVDNPDLAEQITISDVKHRRLNGLLEVNVELSSQYEKTQKLQYHFNWFDENGFVVERGKSPWRPLNLHGLQSTSIQGLAPNESVQSFNVYVRRIPEKGYEY